MHLYPSDIFEKLEFDKILSLSQKECLGPGGIEILKNIKLKTTLQETAAALDETWQYMQSFDRNDPVPLSNYEEIQEELYLLSKEGYVLSVEGIRKLYHAISIGKTLFYFFENPQRQKLNPRLHRIFTFGYQIDAALNDEIDRIIDEEGEVRPDASPELLKISKKISNKERELASTYAKIIFDAKAKNLLADTTESFRNGRRVLTLPAENKRKLGGVIHDESSTGKTVYLEPSAVVPLNNEIFNLYTERKKEVYKVLQELCNQLRPFTGAFEKLYQLIAKLDAIRAKARLGIQLEATRPKLQAKPIFKILKGYNPMLKYKYDKEGRAVVPFTLELHGKNKILVISGPNAGGKSVAMKSIGLIQLMVQSGYCVPVEENSILGIYKDLFVDIGDQQSMEDDLSTYSSHLHNMKYFSEHAGDSTLFLIDEFGSGTDPNIGGAMAEAVLRKLHFQGASGVVTTHYSNLKYYAFKTGGIVNGSMEFDTAKLQPTFTLKVGKPGSSFAYEIASKTGLDKDIIKYAKHKTGKNEKAIDELLITLQEEKKETEEKMAKAIEKEDHLNRLIKNYEQLHRELEYRRKKLKLSKKEQSLFQLGEENREIQRLVRELKETKDLEKAKKLAHSFKKKKEDTREELVQLKDEVYEVSEIDINDFKEGDYVKIRTGTESGQILKINKGKAEIQIGFLKMKVPLKELVPAGAPIEVNSNVSIRTKINSTKQALKTKIDVRGYTPSDTVQLVEELVDNALIHNVNHLTILHGRGNGVLRKAVHKKLKEYKEVSEISHPAEEFGGESVTYVRI